MVITEQQMNELAANVNNVYLHMDNAFGGQCWDSAAWIQNHFGLPVINTGGNGRWPGWAGNMVDAFPQSSAIAAAYELVSPDAQAQPGDTLVWGDSYPQWYPKTHVATAVKDKLNGWILCLSQNSSAPRPDLPGYSPDASGPTIIQLLPKRGLIGIIRPRSGLDYSGNIITTSEEDDMGHVDTISDAAAAKIVQHMLNADYQTSEGKEGKPLWLLRDLSTILAENREKTADAVWGKHLTDDNGNLILPRWIIESFHGILADQRRQTAEAAARLVAEASGLNPEDAYRAISEALDKALDGVQATVTLGRGDK